MSERQSVRVATLTRGREAEAAGVLLDSHASYPAFAAVFPDPGARRRALAPFFRATVRDAVRAGVVHGAHEGDGRLVGVAVWLPPGASPLPLSRKVRMLPALVRVFAAAPRSFSTFARFGNNVERAHPRDAHWDLVVLGVSAEAQRRGVGSALLEAGLRLVDADASDCYLNTSDHANVPFYERFGFSATAPELQLVPNGPSHIAMRRQSPRARPISPA